MNNKETGQTIKCKWETDVNILLIKLLQAEESM